MVPCTLILLPLLLSFVEAENKRWWLTGTPFVTEKSSSTTLKSEKNMWWLTGTPFVTEKSSSTTLKSNPSCQCQHRDSCNGPFSKKMNCDEEDYICCINLKFAEPFIIRPKRTGTENNLEQDSNEGHLDLDAEDIIGDDVKDQAETDGGFEGISDDEFSNSEDEKSGGRDEGGGGKRKETITTCSTSTVSEKIYDFENEDFEGTAEPDNVGPLCGIATPHLLIEDKMADYDPYARFADFPWTLLILESSEGMESVLCGASLIYPGFALSAAHCVQGKNKKNLIVRGGEWDILDKDDSETLPHVNVHVRKMVIHPNFTRLGFHNDIALLILEPVFKPAPHIGTLCLPEKNEKFTDPCLSTGWGMRGNVIAPDAQSKMKRVEIRLERTKACEEKLRRTNLGPRFNLSRSSLCGIPIKKGEDTSQGDGGGPLFCTSITSPKHYTLVGIVSWGKRKYPEAPGVYTSVRKFLEWIRNEIAASFEM